MSGDNSSGDGEKLSARELAHAARAAIEDLTGYEPEAVTGMEWDEESWSIMVDVLELERIPNTTDVMATYAVKLDDRGKLLGYKRERRFVRGSAEAQ
jgi:hypothetical protein